MEEKVREQLLAPFPKNVVQDPPKGKFGKFVNHAVYVERLRDCKVKYSWRFEPTIIDGLVVGGIGTIQVEGLGTFQGAGDVENSALQRATKGECMKLAESDAFKRACMRFGLGVELWSGTDDFFVDDSPKQPAPKKKQELNEWQKRLKEATEHHEKDDTLRETYKLAAWKSVENKDFDTWTDEDFDTYMDAFFELQNEPQELKDSRLAVEEIFGDIKDITRNCPACNSPDWIEDNRAKKEQDEKFKNIPDFACSNFGQNNGCGWGGYKNSSTSEKLVPKEWL
tara:strand:+ start:473 stop:1318 length:846 start_codon:yes stop_codon:yes gene_type:complete